MDKIDHLMAEKNKINKDSQKGQVTPKKNIFLKMCLHNLSHSSWINKDKPFTRGYNIDGDILDTHLRV